MDKIFKGNREWAARVRAEDPNFFRERANQQNPRYLWIGCSDSRVPANQIMGLQPGEVFVHRNVANVVVHTDFNCLSVLQYAVEFLKVEHVIVCGHYGCGGVAASLEPKGRGIIDNWLHHVEDVYDKFEAQLKELPEQKRLDRLCELNVVQQVANVCRTAIVQEAWRKATPLRVHGLIYSLKDGLLKDLGLSCDRLSDVGEAYRKATSQSD
ncbi:MAG: carbonate dehydratase [Fimbriimonadaceae bacterium]